LNTVIDLIDKIDHSVHLINGSRDICMLFEKNTTVSIEPHVYIMLVHVLNDVVKNLKKVKSTICKMEGIDIED
jgi:hypothetical protein